MILETAVYLPIYGTQMVVLFIAGVIAAIQLFRHSQAAAAIAAISATGLLSTFAALVVGARVFQVLAPELGISHEASIWVGIALRLAGGCCAGLGWAALGAAVVAGRAR